MAEIAIRIRGLGKRYTIGARRPNRLLSAAISEQLQKPFFGVHETFARKRDYIWALRDIDLEIPQNTIVGLIGRNGSGKSTLLKILAGITEPTCGQAELYGRIASLLEVGTGFHPELTGRENVYLNGTILGMKRREIDAKFDEIVEFSELSKFIDTPVKRYSSGMAVRLAFAVAAHLEPEILFVDEVLAVGDLKFQRKCLDKMSDVARSGKTILFVTHQMNAVRRLCGQCIWLEKGRISMMGPTSHVVAAYEQASLGGTDAGMRIADPDSTRFLGWHLEAPGSSEPNMLESTEPFTLKLILNVARPIRNGTHGIALFNAEDSIMWGYGVQGLDLDAGTHELVYEIPFLPLRPGIYRWHASIWDGAGCLDEWYATPELVIATEPVAHYAEEWSGILNMRPEFSVT